MTTDIIALMRRKKLFNAHLASIGSAVRFVYGVQLWICVDVVRALNINHDLFQAAPLIGKMAAEINNHINMNQGDILRGLSWVRGKTHLKA